MKPPPVTPSPLFGETRGRLVSLLRAQASTVNDLAAALHLTDNAVRAHLAELQQEDLVVQSGQRPGARKPHALFMLTPKAHELLSRLYVPVLNTVLDLLQQQLPPDQLDTFLRNIGHRLAPTVADPPAPLERRIDDVIHFLATLGGDVTAEKKSDTWVIQGKGCPLASVVSKHPDACRLVETLLADLLGRPVREHCTKTPTPQCCFVVTS